jgi:GWxTD domain-containing protein
MRSLLTLVVTTSALIAAQPAWLDQVAPVITQAEKKTYLALPPPGRADFEARFWEGKAISAQEYFRRLRYVDATFGSSKTASGANTDPGRAYLAIGPPTKITHLPSSRVFVPLEIWYYDSVPGILETELRLIFYQKNSVGLMKLYSPTVDTLRALLIPQAAVQNVWGPNDTITEADIRNKLNIRPTEDEVVSAALNVATGIKYSGNDEILGMITSPAAILRRPPETKVTSRFSVLRPKLDVIQTASVYGGSQVDLRLDAAVTRELDLEVLEDAATVYQNKLLLKGRVEYRHRLDLLPGPYRVVFTLDGKPFVYPLEVKEKPAMSGIFRIDEAHASRSATPFEFEERQIDLNPDGKFAMVTLPEPGELIWIVRRGAEVFWKSPSDGRQIATIELPLSTLAPGTYQLEAVSAADSRTIELAVGASRKNETPNAASLVSFNANLAPSSRYAFVGHQWLLRGNLSQARSSLQSSLAKGVTAEAEVELARADALAGELDEARERVKRVLAVRPNDFQALAVYAYIETRLQDYGVAADLYRRALTVQDSPALRAALAQLPVTQTTSQ